MYGTQGSSLIKASRIPCAFERRITTKVRKVRFLLVLKDEEQCSAIFLTKKRELTYSQYENDTCLRFGDDFLPIVGV
jgi:hypothetical protein